MACSGITLPLPYLLRISLCLYFTLKISYIHCLVEFRLITKAEFSLFVSHYKAAKHELWSSVYASQDPDELDVIKNTNHVFRDGWRKNEKKQNILTFNC
jgi:hypothetical protein